MVCPSGQTISHTDIFLKPKDRIEILRIIFNLKYYFSILNKIELPFLNSVISKEPVSIANAHVQIIASAAGTKNVPPSIIQDFLALEALLQQQRPLYQQQRIVQ